MLQRSRQSVSELKEVDTRCGWILIRVAHTPSSCSELRKKHSAGDAGKIQLDSLIDRLKEFSPSFIVFQYFAFSNQVF